MGGAVDDAPTGLFYKWREGGRTSVAYHRRGSAASRMQPADVPFEALEGASLVHLRESRSRSGTGRGRWCWTSRGGRAQAGAIVTFDPNYRPALWESPAAAAAAIGPVLEHVSWYLCGADDALIGEDELLRRGVEGVVVRRPGGAVVVAATSGSRWRPRGARTVVDEVGAGDAFAAGFAYGLLRGWPPPDRRRGAATRRRLGAARHRRLGDASPRLERQVRHRPPGGP